MFVVSTCWLRLWRLLLQKLSVSWLLWLLWLLVLPVSAEPAPPNILIIDPSAGIAGGLFYQQAVSSFRSAVNSDPVQHASIFVESLQLNRFGGASFEKDLSASLASKYKDRPISMIVTFGDAALRYALKVRAEHWPDVPVIFAMVDPDFARTMPLPPNVTGVTSKQKLLDNINLARAVIPDLARVAIVSDPFETLVTFRTVREEIPGIAASGLELVDLSGMRMRDLRDRVAKLPPHTAIAYLSVNYDGEGGVLLPYEALKRIADVANQPILVGVESQVGLGAVGGLVLVPAQVGEFVVPLVKRILNGESTSSIGVTQGDVVRPIFDWRQLQRWEISEKQLPPSSEVRFRELSAWNLYRLQIAFVIAAILLQATLISWLLYERRYRHIAEVRARERMSELTYMNRVAGAGALSASIAHEVSQPLMGIVTRVGAARRWLTGEAPDIAQAKASLDHIEAASHRAAEIIRNLRALFVRSAPDKISVQIDEVILGVLDLVQTEIRRNQINLQLNIDKNVPRIIANQVQLQQVILNLVMNAIEAMHSAPSRVLTIRSSMTKPGTLRVSVEDTGAGIDAAELSRIFQPLFTTKARGMGMGLTICQSIIESHEGRIWVSAGHSGGSIFQFELPASA